MYLDQDDMQFLGFCGVYTEAYKIIFSWRKIFSQITLALIAPLSFIFLAHMEVSHLIFRKIIHNAYELDNAQYGSPQYHKIKNTLSSEVKYLWLFKFVYFTFLLIFSLLSTSAVVYTVACIYTAREVTFRKVMTVVPKVWKRLMVTFFCTFLIIVIYNLIAVLTFIIWAVTLGSKDVGAIFFLILLIIYLVGFVYLSIVWQLACVISVLEDVYGFRAMKKSKALIKGKLSVAAATFFKLNLSLVVIQIAFQLLVVHGRSRMVNRVAYGILCLLLLFKLILFGLVVQTVIYFVCKSYHHENIDKSSLSDHLEVYLGEYEPLKAKDVQLQKLDV